MALSNETIREILTEKYGELLTDWETQFDQLTVTVPSSDSFDLIQFLYNDARLRFRFLTDMTAVHYPDNKGSELCVVYLIHNLVDNIRLRVKTLVSIDQPDVHSITPIFAGANWMEREAYDFFGVNFVGHPNLIRIMNSEEMNYFPMRKEYAMEDPTRRDKDDEMFGR